MSTETSRLLDDYASALLGKPAKPKTLTGLEALVAIALVPVSIGLWANTEVHLWQWFVVPFGLPAINWAWAMGISALVGAIRSKMDRQRDEDKSDLTLGVFFSYAIGSPLFLLAWGWALTWWMP